MILKHALVMNEDFQLRKLDLKITNGKISRIAEEIAADDSEEEIRLMDGTYILPGFIDTHMHGACGHMINDLDINEEALSSITKYEATQGVTSIALSTICCPPKQLLRQFDLIVSASKKREGAKIAAIHAEGPFISPKKKGAMDECYMLSPKKEFLDQMIRHGEGLLKLITLAPEIEGAMELIPYAVSQGLTVSMGHSDATLQEAQAAIHAGITQATHTFNAMRAYNHREPGILGAALTSPQVCCEMICDYTHLHPCTVQLIYQLKGPDRINIISDSEYGAGLVASEIMVNGQIRYIRNGVMQLEDGTIAGSASSMLVGIQNLLSSGISLEDVSKMASRNPAKTLKLSHITGSIAPGKAADLVVLDSNYRIVSTFVDGVCAYQR